MWCVKVINGFMAVVFGKGKKDKVEEAGEELLRAKKQS